MKNGKPKKELRIRRQYRLPVFLCVEIFERARKFRITETRVVEDALRTVFNKP